MKHEQIQSSALLLVKAELEAGRDSLPRVVEVHPTDLCNHRCSFCFHGGIGGRLAEGRPLLTLKRYAALFAELASLQVKELSISGGGEPFVHPQIAELLEAALAAGLRIRVVSNGHCIADKAIPSLLQCHEVRFSLDAATAGTYAAVHGVADGAFSQTLTNIRRLLTARQDSPSPLQIGATFLANERNYQEAAGFCRLTLEELRLDAAVVKYDIFPHHPSAQGLCKALKKQLAPFCGPRLEVRAPLAMRLDDLRCFMPCFKVAANPYGDLYSCCLGSQPGEQNGYLLGNLADSAFTEVWKKSSDIRRTLRNQAVKCQACNHSDYLINTAMRAQLAAV